MILKIISLAAAIFFVTAPAFAADNYQTDIGPTPKKSAGANVQGRGTVPATLDSNKFSLQAFDRPLERARLHRQCDGRN